MEVVASPHSDQQSRFLNSVLSAGGFKYSHALLPSHFAKIFDMLHIMCFYTLNRVPDVTANHVSIVLRG